jgi:hypothetical protein
MEKKKWHSHSCSPSLLGSMWHRPDKIFTEKHIFFKQIKVFQAIRDIPRVIVVVEPDLQNRGQVA